LFQFAEVRHNGNKNARTIFRQCGLLKNALAQLYIQSVIKIIACCVQHFMTMPTHYFNINYTCMFVFHYIKC